MDDLFKGFATSTAQRDSVHQQDPHRHVHTLVDLTGSRNAPPGVLRGRKLPGLTHPTHGEMVFAVKDAFPRSISETILKVMHAEGKFFDTLDEAWAYLHTLIKPSSVETVSTSSLHER